MRRSITRHLRYLCLRGYGIVERRTPSRENAAFVPEVQYSDDGHNGWRGTETGRRATPFLRLRFGFGPTS